jgi:hypothetical protein
VKTKPAQLASLFAIAGLGWIVVLLSPTPAMAMHITEGYPPIQGAPAGIDAQLGGAGLGDEQVLSDQHVPGRTRVVME